MGKKTLIILITLLTIGSFAYTIFLMIAPANIETVAMFWVFGVLFLINTLLMFCFFLGKICCMHNKEK